MQQEEWDLWKHNEITKEFFGFLASEVERAKNEWSEGQHNERNLEAVSAVKAFKSIIAIDYNDVMGVDDE